MKELKDTQNERDDRKIAIDRVGVKALRFPVALIPGALISKGTRVDSSKFVALPHIL